MNSIFVCTETHQAFEHLCAHAKLSSEDHDEIISQYTMHGRCYHTLHHLAQMWMLHCELSSANEPNNLVLARTILFHDFYYDATASDNEQKSAERYCQSFGRHDWGSDAILASADHFARRSLSDYPDFRREWFIGLDLASLAAPAPIFDANALMLRAEYHHLSNDQWNTGRKSFCSKALQRLPLYQHPVMQKNFEKQAVENLKRAVEADIL